MFASLRKIFNKDQDGDAYVGQPGDESGIEVAKDEENTGCTAKTPESASKKPSNTPGQISSPLDIPWQHTVSAASGDNLVASDDEEELPSRLISMSCPLPGNRGQPKIVPRRPAVKPAVAPKMKLPNLELPPSLPSDYVIPEPPPPIEVENTSFVEYANQYAASCPAAFRLVVNAQGLPTPLPAYVQLEAKPMANSPLIYEVLLSGCLINSVQKMGINGTKFDVCLEENHYDEAMPGSHDDDELEGMEL